jgi:calcium-dependent protein kinase
MHRDLKPENIMILSDQKHTIKLIDFGLSHFVDEVTLSHPKCGTPGYMAPEVANYKDHSPRYNQACDMFSAGVIFYRIVTHHELFAGRSSRQIYEKNKACKLNLQLVDLYTMQNPYMRDLLKCMLHEDPSQRITINKALQHSFFLETEDSTDELSPDHQRPCQRVNRRSFRVNLQREKLEQRQPNQAKTP